MKKAFGLLAIIDIPNHQGKSLSPQLGYDRPCPLSTDVELAQLSGRPYSGEQGEPLLWSRGTVTGNPLNPSEPF